MSMGKPGDKLTYARAGVDIAEADRLMAKISPHLKKTFSREVIGDIGGFSAFFQLDLKKLNAPVLLATTDGVGTKLKIAIESGRVDRIGVDLVAMCVNDMIVHGGRPLFFLDYFATGRLDSRVAARVIRGIVSGCLQAGCSLIGGETAEMPSLYGEKDFDVAGFCVGIVEKKDIITGSGIAEGDVVLGIPSSGFHSNGFSLIRKVLLEREKLTLDDLYPGSGKPLWKVLLTPTRIYVKPVLQLLKTVKVKGMAHITGGGFFENIKRIIPDGLKADIDTGRWKIPAIFSRLQAIGNIENEEMFRTFNMGIGMIVVVRRKKSDQARRALAALGTPCREIGEIKRSDKKKMKVEVLF